MADGRPNEASTRFIVATPIPDILEISKTEILSRALAARICSLVINSIGLYNDTISIVYGVRMYNFTPTELLGKTIGLIDGAYAPATIRAYKSNFQNFINFCEKLDRNALPASPEVVAEYIVDISNMALKSASIRLAVAAISTIHKLNRLEDPTSSPEFKLELRRMHRKLGRGCQQAHGINYETLQKMLDASEKNTLRGMRDRALLQIAYDSMCRRSELVSLQVPDVIFGTTTAAPTRILLRKSKTDPDAVGKWLYISEAGQVALETWLMKSGIADGAIFRGVTYSGKITSALTSGQINRIYKRLATASKLDPELIAHISGHSMRVGAAQDLLISGATLPMIMSRGRWSKTDTVMRYVESANLYLTTIPTNVLA